MKQFGPFLPDLVTLESGASTIARNVIPAATGFRPFKSFLMQATALSSKPVGGISCRSTSTLAVGNFVGTLTNLYKVDDNGLNWLDVSRLAGGAYTTSVDGFWSFCQFGDTLIATNKADDVQAFDLASGTNFDALGGSAPIAQYAVVVREFVMLGGLGDFPNRVQWSGIGDPADYVPSITTMSDYQDFPDGGRVMGLAGGDVGIVLCEKAIYRMSFEGPPVIFRFDKIGVNIGCRAPRSIASYENLTFFLAYDGLYMIRGASEMVPIGSEKVDQWLRDNVNFTTVDQITAAIDPVRKIYLMGFVSVYASTPDMVLLYHWPTGQFSYVDFDHSLLYASARQEGVTIDGLADIAATIDDLPYTIDSFFYSGTGQLSLAAFDSSFRQGFFDGDNMEATIETGDTQPSAGRKSLVRALRPLVDGDFTGITTTLRSRDAMNNAMTDSTPSVTTETGMCNFRVNARYHRAQVKVPANASWNYMIGIDDLKYSTTGER